jgi:hypothetical protein
MGLALNITIDIRKNVLVVIVTETVLKSYYDFEDTVVSLFNHLIYSKKRHNLIVINI